jgi:hypothetical protein
MSEPTGQFGKFAFFEIAIEKRKSITQQQIIFRIERSGGVYWIGAWQIDTKSP